MLMFGRYMFIQFTVWTCPSRYSRPGSSCRFVCFAGKDNSLSIWQCFIHLIVIYYDHWILISCRAFGWLYDRNIWNCDKGVPAQIERNGFKSQICSEVHLGFFPCGYLSHQSSALHFQVAFAYERWRNCLEQLLVRGLLFQHHGQITTNRRTLAGKTGSSLRTCLCRARTPLGGSAWTWVPHFRSDLGCGFTCNERNVDIHVHHQRKIIPRLLILSICMDMSARNVHLLHFLQHKTQWPTLHCGDEMVKLILIIASRRSALPLQSPCLRCWSFTLLCR